MSPGKMAIPYRGSLGGADRVRTGDPLLAKQVLYQLSYDPWQGLEQCLYKERKLKFTLCDQSEPRRQQLSPPLPSTIGLLAEAIWPSP